MNQTLPKSTYPAAIHFVLTGSNREKVLDAAEAMSLSVTHQQGGGFYVWVRSPDDAYELGRRSGVLKV